MVNEIIKHLNSIGEVNLSAQKIELGSVQDLEARVKAMVPDFNELQKTSDQRLEVGIEYSKLKDKEKKLASSLESDAKGIEKDLEKVKQQAKDLGVDVDTKFIESNLKGLKQGIKSSTAF
jgi:seryl-tRNA synthetase